MNITLRDLVFPAKLCDLFKNLYSTSSTRLIVNDSLTDTLPITRGTRQGCPLSPLIYAIIAELFNQSIINNEDFTGHTMAKMHKKITAYADDTLGAASLAQWSVSWLWLGRARVRSPLTAIFLKNFILEKANNVLLVRD